MFTFLSTLIIPIMVLGVVIYGIVKKVSIYDVFVEGAKESFEMVITIFPCLLAMILGTNLFLKSGFLDFFFQLLEPFFSYLKVPLEILPMAIMRPISGNASLAILNQIFEASGPDSFRGRLASVIQGSTETTFYVLTLYFGSIGIKKIKHAMWAGLLVDLVGIIAAIVIVGLLF